MAIFLKNPDTKKTQQDGPILADKREHDDELWQKSTKICLGGVCVWVCLFACAGAYVLLSVVLSEIHAATVLSHFLDLIPQCRGNGALA